jgi:hypothetical protein
VTVPFEEKSGQFAYTHGDKRMAALRCIACRQYILEIIRYNYGERTQSFWWSCLAHFPLGKPNDAVAEEIPEHIRLDFQEALRCQWVRAYNATVEMCRRAIENSCLDKKVPDNMRTLHGFIRQTGLTLCKMRLVCLESASFNERLGDFSPMELPPNLMKRARLLLSISLS